MTGEPYGPPPGGDADGDANDRSTDRAGKRARMANRWTVHSLPTAKATLSSEPKPKREKCCGIRWEHGAFTQAPPCHDCPDMQQ